MVRFRSPAPFFLFIDIFGEIPERPKGADCKSAVHDFGGSNPPLPTKASRLRYVAVGGLFFIETVFNFTILC